MKDVIFLFILIFLILGIDINAQNKPKDSDVYLLRIELMDSLNNQNKEINKIKVDFAVQEQSLKNKLEDASTTIEYLNSLVSSFGLIFTILAIFIGIITLALPILTYLFGVRPSVKALKELESNMDARLEEYLKNTRNKQIENALLNIKGDSTELKHQGLSFLTITQHEGFSDNQMFQFYSILKNSQTEQSTKSQLAYILTTRKNDYSTELFNSEEVINDPVIKQMAQLYYVKIGFSENYKGIKNILKNESEQYDEFKTWLFILHQYSSSDALKLLNNSRIIDLLGKDTLIKMKSDLPSILKTINIDQKDFEESYLHEQIKKTPNKK